MLSRPRSSLDATVMKLVLVFLVVIGAALTWIYLTGAASQSLSPATAPQKTQAVLPPTAGTPAAGVAVATRDAQTFTIVPAESRAAYRVGETFIRENNRFNLAQGTTTAIEGLPQTYADGQTLSLRVKGNLKIRDVTRPTTFAVTLRLQGNVLRGTATTAFKMTDFGFDPPSILGILRAQNDVQVELRFTARPGQ